MKLGHYKLFSMVNNLFGYFTMLWTPEDRTSLAPKTHTCSSPDDDGGDDAADDADEDRLPRAVSDGHWPK